MSDDKKVFCCADKYNLYEMCSHCYNSYFSDPEFEAAMHDAYWDDYGTKPSPELKCECGGGAIANNTHSSWCPKFIGG
jgi:hypothetical protein